MEVDIHHFLVLVQRSISCVGILVILSGIIMALMQYTYYVFTGQITHNGDSINTIRLNLGRILILGLEFIVAADLIGSTTTPDYYTVGILAIIVAIRTLLSFSLNKEIMDLSKK
jgi:uncharacterized membrane protein